MPLLSRLELDVPNDLEDNPVRCDEDGGDDEEHKQDSTRDGNIDTDDDSFEEDVDDLLGLNGTNVKVRIVDMLLICEPDMCFVFATSLFVVLGFIAHMYVPKLTAAVADSLN